MTPATFFYCKTQHFRKQSSNYYYKTNTYQEYPFCCWVCFRTTLTHLSAFYKFYVADENRWKIGFRRPLSHILCVYISCFRGLWFVFGQHSHTLWLSKNIWINEKSVFVDPSHTFCLSRYDASDGFGLFSDNSHTLCGFLQTYELMRNRFSYTLLTDSVCLDMMLLKALVCFRITLIHFVVSMNIWIWLWDIWIWLWFVFGAHSHTLCF